MRTVGVRLTAEISDYQRKLRQAGKETQDFAGEMGKAAKGGHLDAVADQAGVAGLALAGMAAGAVKLSMDFEKSMSAVSAATHASSKDMEQLRQAALKAGKDTQYSATEAADAITELSKAGVGTADVLGGALDGALDLAAAGQLDVAEAAETAASAMTQFGLKGNKVPHIADLLAAAAGKAQGSVHDMGYALNQSGLVASQFGLSIEDTTGALAEFASAGLLGSDAGTSFKSMLLAIANPSGVTAKKMQALGISFYDAQGKFIGLSGVADELRDKLGQLTQEERNAALGQIFGSDAIRAATILYKDGSKGVEEWRKKVDDSGYAAETAAKLTDNLAGDIERLKGSLETAAIESGGGLNQGLRIITKSAEAMVEQLDKLPSGATATVTALAAVGGTLALGFAGWVKMRGAVASAIEQLEAVGPAGTKAARGLQAASRAAGIAAAAFAAAEVAAAGFEKLGNAAVNVDDLTTSLENYTKTGKVAGEATQAFGEDLKGIGLTAQMAVHGSEGIIGFLDKVTSFSPGTHALMETFQEWATGTSIGDAKDKMAALSEAFAKFAATQDDATKAGEIWNQIQQRTGLSTEQLAKVMPEAWKAMQDLQAKAHGVAGATGEAADGIEGVGGAAEKSSGQVIALSKSIDELFQTQISADRAAIKLAESTGDLTAELTKGTRTLNINTEEGRKNRKAVLDQLDAIEANRDARVRGHATLDEANKKYEKDIDGLRKIMKQAGFTTKEINGLVGAYDDIPRQVKTDIKVVNDGSALAKIKRLLIAQQAASKGISISAATSAFNKNAGYATGGRTPMVGEDEPAGVVHGKEFVLNAATVRRVDQQAPGFLDEMHTTGRLPGYATGGRVAHWPYPVNMAGAKIPEWSAPPSGGQTSDWIVAAARALVPGIRVLSKDRPGARTLSGNVSYHARGRAVDFAPSEALARLWNEHYMRATKELISPYQQYNIHNGSRHRYTGAIWNQHNFAGGNAHDHIAMRNGGTITEPIFGVGASGRTYSFGENWQPERVMPMTGAAAAGGSGVTNVNLTVNAAVGSHPRDIGRQVVEMIGEYLGGGGELRVRGTKVF